jgi:alpha-glucuronidase
VPQRFHPLQRTCALGAGRAPGWYTLHIQYFDLPTGVSRFRVLVASQVVDEWTAADRPCARKIDGSSSGRRVISGIALRPGDAIRIEGVPDGGDPAALDYLEIQPGAR